jgi:hypothetical protein
VPKTFVSILKALQKLNKNTTLSYEIASAFKDPQCSESSQKDAVIDNLAD